MRPFYLMVPFWGKRYREYFVDLCLPSLLSPNNLQRLDAQDGHRFLIATPAADWDAVKDCAIMRRLAKHATPTWQPIAAGGNAPTSGTADQIADYASVINYLTPCLRTLLDQAFHAKAFGFQMCPDTLFTDGTIAFLQERISKGIQLVLCPALRQVEEDALQDLHSRGLLDINERRSETASDIQVSARVMAEILTTHLHPEMFPFCEDGEAVPPYAPFRYWRVPRERGMIIHTFFGCPVMMDMSILNENHTQCLDQEAFENIYYQKNFAKAKLHVVRDSDEMSILSLTPATVNFAHDFSPPKRPLWRRRYDQLHAIRTSMRHFGNNPEDNVRRELFLHPVRWHKGDIDSTWLRTETRIQQLLNGAVSDYYAVAGFAPPEDSLAPAASRITHQFIVFAQRVAILDGHVTFMVNVIFKRLRSLIAGDPDAVAWARWRLRKMKAMLLRRRFEEPRPPINC